MIEPIQAAITFLKTRDLAATSAFYEQVLGLRLALDQGTCRIYAVCGGAYLGFCLMDGPTGSGEGAPAKDAPAGANKDAGANEVIVTLVVADVDRACQQLEAAGAPIEVRPRINPRYQIYQCFARDPNGYLLEIQRFLDPQALAAP